MELPNDGTNERSKDGLDGIALKVIFQGLKGQIVPFSHIYLYYSVVPDLEMSISRSGRSNMGLCDLFALISQKRCML